MSEPKRCTWCRKETADAFSTATVCTECRGRRERLLRLTDSTLHILYWEGGLQEEQYILWASAINRLNRKIKQED